MVGTPKAMNQSHVSHEEQCNACWSDLIPHPPEKTAACYATRCLLQLLLFAMAKQGQLSLAIERKAHPWPPAAVAGQPLRLTNRA